VLVKPTKGPLGLDNTNDPLRLRERLIARGIQTSVLPREVEVEGLEVAATMVTASEVGGDYYDILPFDGGAWFGIGDVSGRGIGAGTVMLMVQSAVAALTRHASGPREVIVDLDAILYDNIKRRIRGDQEVTCSLMRYTTDGRIQIAGTHEDIIVWRAASGRCEQVAVKGQPQLGAGGAVAGDMPEIDVQLARGDIVLLYTDGVIEARDGLQRFGIERLMLELGALAGSSPRPSVLQICDALVGCVLRFGVRQLDDMSLVVLEYRG
jgi:sigma-B regulation protein RsbU (phosphoserine phosphatase)